MARVIKRKDDKKEFVTAEENKRVSPIGAYLQQISQYPLLTEEEEVELAKKIANGDNEAREKFINSNLRLVVYVAKKYNAKNIDFLDIIQEGNIGLINAVQKFDYTLGYKFSTYAISWINQAILKELFEKSDLIRLPIYIKEKILKYNRIKDDFFAKNNRYPTDQEIIKLMDISESELKDLKDSMYQTISINESVSEDGETELGDFIEDTSYSPEKIVEKDSEKIQLRSIIERANLSQMELKVITTLFDLDCNQINSIEKVAKELHLSKGKVRMIESRALRKLKYIASSEKLK